MNTTSMRTAHSQPSPAAKAKESLSSPAPALNSEKAKHPAKPAQEQVVQRGTSKPSDSIDEANVVRAIGRATNGKGMPRVPAIEWLNDLLAERPDDPAFYAKRRMIAMLAEALTKRGEPSAELWEVTPDDIGSCKAQMISEKLSNTTIHIGLGFLGTMFQVAKRRHLVRRNVVRKVSKPKRLKNSPRRPFTDAELIALLDCADDEWFGMILVALYTGLRLGDLARLVYRDIDLTTRFIRANVKKTKRFEPKPIPPLLEAYFRQLPWPTDLDKPLFPRAYGIVINGKTAKLSVLFRLLLEKAGLRPRGLKVRGSIREGADKYLPLSFHCLRHNHTSMLKKGNIAEAVARRIAGHMSIEVSDVYTFLGEDVMLAAVAGLPEIDGVSTCY